MEIREIRPEEVGALADLTVRVYESIGATEDGGYVVHLRDVQGRIDAGCTVLVAVEGGAVLGGTAYVPGPGEWSDLCTATEAELRMLVVDPAHQRTGIGEALVRACIGLAAEQGKERLVLLSNHMMTAAHRLYERLGFVRTPDRDWYVSENVDLKAYALTIPHPGRA